MKSILIIASNTFRDAIRQKLILLIALIALALVISSKYFLKLDLGHEQLRFVFDFGSGAIGFFGSIIAIVSTCQLFHAEIDNKTVVTLLSKPVGSAEFACGKLLGAAAVLALFSAIITLATCSMLFYTQASFGESAQRLSAGLKINYCGVAACCFVQWVKLCAIASVAAAVCSFSRSLLFSAVISFMCLAISLMGAVTIGLGGERNGFANFVSTIFPDFQIFNSAEAFAFSPIVPEAFLGAVGYGAIYVAALCILTSLSFSKREF